MASGSALYQEAVAVVREQGSASPSLLSARMRIPALLAADLIEQMERAGVVGAQGKDGARPVLPADDTDA